MGAVWDLDLSHPRQSVMLALADHAHDDGTHCYPGVPYIAWKTGYTERNVTRILADLEEDGLIEAVAGKSGGYGNHTEYEIHIEKGDKKTPFQPKSLRKRVTSQTKTLTTQTQKGDNSDGNPDNSAEKGDKRDNGLYIHPRAVEPSRNHKEPSVVVGAAPTGEPPLPDDETARSLLLLKRVSGFPRNQGENALYLAELREEFPDVDAAEVCRQYEVWHRDNQNKTKNHRGRLRNFFSKANGDISSGRKPPSRASPISPKNDAANDKWKPEMLSDDELRRRGIVNW